MSHWPRTITTLTRASLSLVRRLSRAWVRGYASLLREYRNPSRNIESTWLAHSQLFLIGLGLTVTCITCDSDACCSPRSKIQPSHRRDRVTFWLRGLCTNISESIRHLNTERQLFFSLQYFGSIHPFSTCPTLWAWSRGLLSLLKYTSNITNRGEGANKLLCPFN